MSGNQQRDQLYLFMLLQQEISYVCDILYYICIVYTYIWYQYIKAYMVGTKKYLYICISLYSKYSFGTRYLQFWQLVVY